MVGEQLKLDMNNIAGANQPVTINFGATASTFTVGGKTYDIINAASPQVSTPADQVTYRQLMDVMSMAVGIVLPAQTTTDGHQRCRRKYHNL